LKLREKQKINIQLNPVDMNFVKAKAQETGTPFQAIIGALVHNYAIGKIKLEI
jgi:predicted DNA binding CopG/RHH family protein